MDLRILIGQFQTEMFYDSKYRQREGNFIVEQLHSGNEAQHRGCFAVLFFLVCTLNSSVLVS